MLSNKKKKGGFVSNMINIWQKTNYNCDIIRTNITIYLVFLQHVMWKIQKAYFNGPEKNIRHKFNIICIKRKPRPLKECRPYTRYALSNCWHVSSLVLFFNTACSSCASPQPYIYTMSLFLNFVDLFSWVSICALSTCSP